ncbi:hypothetical protein V1264_006513 [Littorina saxatilis]|uniref:Kinesin-like protein n=1 Tax=Littorina saxatilis TaxID=31220 RepID=A0AAN9AXT8_9CAEN
MAYTSPMKQARGKRHLPDVPVDSPGVKGVSFNSNVVETSIGGTQTVAKMKGDPLAPVTGSKNLASTHTGVASQNQIASNVISGKGLTPACQTRQAKGQESREEAENKENVEKTDDTRTPRMKTVQQSKPVTDDDAVFASPIGRPAKAALLIKEFEKFTPTRPNHDNVRRTTQEYLDQVPQNFVTPPQHQLRRHTLETRVFETPDCYRSVQMETPRKPYLDLIPGTDDSMTEADGGEGEDSCSIMVAVRVRPYSQRELSDPNVKRVVSMGGNETTVTTDGGNVHRFAFDFSFWSFDQENGDFACQGQVYTSLAQPLLGKAFEGYNTCLFAYGQTGSGKSYSIMGHGQDTGIIPRFCEELFSRAVRASNKDKVKISVEISFFEIYNEKIHDLLASSKEKNGKKATLKVREHPVLGPYVEGLSTFVVNSFEDVEGWITLGTKNRATAATGMNDKSSRSHSVFTIVLTQTKTERVENQDHDHSITSKINLVDLAGSERQSQAQTTGERLREGANINKSLLTLGKVISVLAERSMASKKRKLFIPYRDSVLTWLLKESLGGNSKTAMIATISPSHHHQEETLSTLRYPLCNAPSLS